MRGSRVFLILVLLGLAAWWAYGTYATSHRPSGLSPVSVDPASSSRDTDANGGETQTVAATQQVKPPTIQALPMAQSKPNLDPIVAFSTATNQQEAMEAIRRLEQTNLSSALDARAMMTPCRLISQTPNYLGSSIDSWHKSGLIEYCRGHDDPGASESIRRSREEGTKAQILQKLRSIEEVQGIEAALAQLQEMLKTEQDPFAVQALFEYLAVSNRSGNEALFDRALRGFPLSAGVPRDVLGITSQLAYCEMSGGCGPYHLITLDACAVAGRCPPGASYRDFYALTVPPVWMQDVDTVLARWHSLRRCGRYQCGP